MVRSIEMTMENTNEEEPLTIKELNNAIKTKKSPGPHTIPNEIFIKATTPVRTANGQNKQGDKRNRPRNQNTLYWN